MCLKPLFENSKSCFAFQDASLQTFFCSFKAYIFESTLLEIQNPAVTSRKHLLKVSGHSTQGEFQESLCTLDHLMCTIEAQVLEIQKQVLTSGKHLLKFSGHSAKGELQNCPCTLDHLICTFKVHMLKSTLPEIQNPALTYRYHLLKVSSHSTKGYLQNSPCKLDLLMCILKAYLLETTVTDIQSPCSDLQEACPGIFRSFNQKETSRIVCARQIIECAHSKLTCWKVHFQRFKTLL